MTSPCIRARPNRRSRTASDRFLAHSHRPADANFVMDSGLSASARKHGSPPEAVDFAIAETAAVAKTT